jgi:predicted O-linked N-acetylglucosamine transferase (SPINDLY family)
MSFARIYQIPLAVRYPFGMAKRASASTDRVLALIRRGEEAQAEDAIQKVLQREPNNALAWAINAQLLEGRGETARAEQTYARAIAIDPACLFARSNLGLLYEKRGFVVGALEQYEEAIKLAPNNSRALSNFGGVLCRAGDLRRAQEVLAHAIALAPDNASAHVNLGLTLSPVGLQDEALEHLTKAVRLQADNETAHHARLLTIHYASKPTPEEVAEAHFEYGRMMEKKYPELAPPTYFDAGRRPLRVGFVSADFRKHSVAYFLEPLLEHLSREDFAVYAYSTFSFEDEHTVRFRELCTVYREVEPLSAADFAQLIRDDEIDILIDLNSHTARGRLDVFAMRPAPVSMTYLGYPNTTGLSRIDFRITDEESDPIGTTEALHSERLLRLEAGFLCYRPPASSPAVAPCPSDANGGPTFGSFNALTKVSEHTLSLWARILAREPDARFVMKQSFLASASAREMFEARLSRAGIPMDRVELLGNVPDQASHLATYGLMDVALDTYPYHGTTTTCESLWMGVPVVSLAGRAHVSRVGCSLLSRVGIQDLVVASDEAYVEKAIEIARDVERRRALRADLRRRMQNGGLVDAARFAAGFGSMLQRAHAIRVAEIAQSAQRSGQSGRAANDQLGTSSAAQRVGPSLPDADARWLRLSSGIYLAAPATFETFEGYVLEERHGWYESELSFASKLVQNGEHVLDLGAGVGIYAATLAAATGPGGSVTACTDSARDLSRIQAGSQRNRQPQLVASLQLPKPSSSVRKLPSFVRISPSEIPACGLPALEVLCLKGEPVVMVEVARDPEAADAVIGMLTKAGLETYRLVPGLEQLYPFAYGKEDCPLLSNVFAVPASRAKKLHAQGLLSAALMEAEPPSDECLREAAHLVSTLSDVDLASSFAAAQGKAAVYRKALVYYSATRRVGGNPEHRAYALRCALDFALASIEEPTNVSRLSTLARIAGDWGQRAVAVQAAETALAIHRAGKGRIPEPFLPGCARYDSISPGKRHAEHAVAALMEQYELCAAYSTYFTRDDPETLRRLLMLHKLGFQDAEMARRLSLVRQFQKSMVG